MPALKSAFEAQTEQKKHPLLIHGTDSIRHIFVEDIMYAENSLRRITYTLYNLSLIHIYRANLLKAVDTAAGKVVNKLIFGLRDSLEQDTFLECVAGLEKLYEE